jgi:hypothetical protein
VCHNTRSILCAAIADTDRRWERPEPPRLKLVEDHQVGQWCYPHSVHVSNMFESLEEVKEGPEPSRTWNDSGGGDSECLQDIRATTPVAASGTIGSSRRRGYRIRRRKAVMPCNRKKVADKALEREFVEMQLRGVPSPPVLCLSRSSSPEPKPSSPLPRAPMPSLPPCTEQDKSRVIEKDVSLSTSPEPSILEMLKSFLPSLGTWQPDCETLPKCDDSFDMPAQPEFNPGGVGVRMLIGSLQAISNVCTLLLINRYSSGYRSLPPKAKAASMCWAVVVPIVAQLV